MKRLIILFCIIGAFVAPVSASAATLSLDIEQTVVDIGSPFDVEIVLDTEYAVNAVEAGLVIPSGLELADTSDGNTIVSLWIERPRYDREAHILHFSGIIPGGFSGTGKLLKLTLKAEVAGSFALVFDRTRTAIYRNSPDGTPEPTTLRSLMLNAKAGTTITVTPTVDTAPPEAFTPVITRDPQLYDGALTLLFATQDKNSGIAYYEVSESPVRKIDSNKLTWTMAESPYRLNDQTPARYIYVRAVDGQGNIRTELYAPVHQLSWFEYLALGILMLVFVLFVFRLWRNKRHYASL